jgi:hypothetical protein
MESSIKLKRITVYYDKTTLSEIMDAGYSVKPEIKELWEYHSESQTATCVFFKNGRVMGWLWFYDAPASSLDNLKARPVNHVSLAKVSERASMARLIQEQKIRNATIRQHALKKIILSILVHMAGISAFYCAYTVPAFQVFLHKVVMVNRVPIAGFFAIVLIAVPAILITYIWSNKFLFQTSLMPLKQRLFLSVILILNVIISLCYLVLLDIILKA